MTFHTKKSDERLDLLEEAVLCEKNPAWNLRLNPIGSCTEEININI